MISLIGIELRREANLGDFSGEGGGTSRKPVPCELDLPVLTPRVCVEALCRKKATYVASHGTTMDYTAPARAKSTC